MTNTLNLQQRLRAQTGQARRQHAEVEAQVKERQNDSPRPGDLYVLAKTAEQGIEWAVLESDGPWRLIVPADTNPLAGSTDVAVPEDATRGPLTLRCALGVQLAVGRLEPQRCTGTLESIYLERALRKRHLIAEGGLVGTTSERRADRDPEYQSWIEILGSACEAVSPHVAASAVQEVAAHRPTCFLEGFPDDREKTWRTEISRSGLLIGRQPDADLVLRAKRVSKHHAELFHRDNRHWIRALDKAAGTYVNSKRVTGDQPIEDGDVVLFGDRELRYVVNVPGGAEPDQWQLLPPPSQPLTDLRRERLNRIVHFEARFQPLVRLENYSDVGYELVGAGDLEGTPWLTPALFQIARRLGRETEIAELRSEGMNEAESLPPNRPVLVSIDPEELKHEERLTASLRELSNRHPNRTLVIEIEDYGVTDPAALAALSSRLNEIGVEIAFHNFGGDESRLRDLIRVHPRFVKFGSTWTRDLHHASPTRRHMVSRLVQFMTRHGVMTVAEGIDTEEQGRVCRALGFALGQGSFLGAPVLAGAIPQGAHSAPPAEL